MHVVYCRLADNRQCVISYSDCPRIYLSVPVMWSESDGERELQEHEAGMGRSSAGAELVMMDDRAMASSSWAAPGVANLNVTKFSKVHIGNKFVTQNVHNSEVVKG